jgi:hypothetical protein
MRLNYPTNPSASAETAERTGFHPTWNERIVTAAATVLAVLVVAAIAVLMGMS